MELIWKDKEKFPPGGKRPLSHFTVRTDWHTIRPDSNTTAHIDAFYRSTKLAHDPQIIFTNRTVRTVRKTISQFVRTVRIVYLHSMFYHLHDPYTFDSIGQPFNQCCNESPTGRVTSRVESLKGRVTSRVISVIDRLESSSPLHSSRVTCLSRVEESSNFSQIIWSSLPHAFCNGSLT